MCTICIIALSVTLRLNYIFSLNADDCTILLLFEIYSYINILRRCPFIEDVPEHDRSVFVCFCVVFIVLPVDMYLNFCNCCCCLFRSATIVHMFMCGFTVQNCTTVQIVLIANVRQIVNCHTAFTNRKQQNLLIV